MGHDEALQTIVSCLTHPTGIEKSDAYHHQSDWMVRGSDLSGSSLTVCVVIEADVLVVTVF